MTSAEHVSLSETRKAPLGRMRAISVTIMVLLIAQFLVGMGLNFFAVFPTDSSGGPMEQVVVSGMLQTGPGLVVHALNALVILALSVVGLYFSLKAGIGLLTLLAVLGLAFVVLALVGGVTFVISGFQDDFDSFLMSLGFIFAISSYFSQLYFAKPAQRQRP